MLPVDQVQDSQAGVVNQHAWAGITHYLPDLLTTAGLEAVNRTLGTGGFIETITAMLDTAVSEIL